MKGLSFNDGWEVRPQQATGFLGGAPAAEQVTLPHDAAIRLQRDPAVKKGAERGFFPCGVWEYAKKVTIPEDYADKHVELRFEGAYARATVYINDAFAGQRPNGYAEFCIDCDRFLRYGAENEIKVIVRTTDDARWYSGAGLYRPVSLLVSGLTYLRDVRVSTPRVTDGLAVVRVAARVCSEGKRGMQTPRMLVALTDEAGQTVAEGSAPVTVYRGETVTAEQTLTLHSPSRWDVERPYLYGCLVRLMDGDAEIDREETAFGVRDLALDRENGLQINGRTVKLRGACIHHDNGLLGAATYRDAETRRVRILKEAGFNALRMAHHPAGRALLDACDRLGMLVMDEAFDVWTDSKNSMDYAVDFESWWEKDVESMVAKDFNHPCVVLYSIGNEIAETGKPQGAARGRKIAQKVRALDATRFTLNAVNGMLSVMDRMGEILAQRAANMADKDINQAMTDVGDRIAQIMRLPLIGEATEEAYSCVDIAGYNYMHGRYETDRELFPNRILCGSETHPSNIDRNWGQVTRLPHVIGDFTWTGWDYLGEVGIGRVVYNNQNALIRMEHKADYPWLTAWCGDMDITGFRRTISYYREIVFGLRKAPYLAVFSPAHYGEEATYMQWSWSDTRHAWDWQGFEGKPIQVEVYADADEVELLVNGRSLGRKPAGQENRFKALFDTAYEPGTLEAAAWKDGVEIGRDTLCTPSEEKLLCVTPEREQVTLSEQALIYAEVSLRDAAGVPVNCDSLAVTLRAEGDAELLAFGSAKPDNTESWFAGSQTLFGGRAMAILRPTAAGTVVLRAEAEGYEPAVAEISVSR